MRLHCLGVQKCPKLKKKGVFLFLFLFYFSLVIVTNFEKKNGRKLSKKYMQKCVCRVYFHAWKIHA